MKKLTKKAGVLFPDHLDRSARAKLKKKRVSLKREKVAAKNVRTGAELPDYPPLFDDPDFNPDRYIERLRTEGVLPPKLKTERSYNLSLEGRQAIVKGRQNAVTKEGQQRGELKKKKDEVLLKKLLLSRLAAEGKIGTRCAALRRVLTRVELPPPEFTKNEKRRAQSKKSRMIDGEDPDEEEAFFYEDEGEMDFRAEDFAPD